MPDCTRAAAEMAKWLNPCREATVGGEMLACHQGLRSWYQGVTCVRVAVSWGPEGSTC